MFREKIDTVTKENLRNSDNDGKAYTIMSGMAENNFPAFAVFCGMSTQQVGILMSLPHFIGNIIQVVTTLLLAGSEKRKNWIVFGAVMQGIALLPLAVGVLFLKTISFKFILFSMILFLSAGLYIAPLWNAMMGDVVPDDIRGRYFGSRNSMLGMFTFCFIALSGIILYFSKRFNYEHIGFAMLFVTGFIGRMFSSVYLTRMTDPCRHIEAPGFDFMKLFLDRDNRNYLNFVLFFSLIHLSVFVAGPYFAVYMLKELHFNYIEFTMASMTIIIAQFLTMSSWGKLSDKFGNREIIKFTGLWIIIAPLLWLISGNLWYVVFIQIFAGVAWAGFSLSCGNYIFDSLDTAKRAVGFSALQFMIGVAIFLGASIGGIIVNHIETHGIIFLKSLFGGYNIRPLFLISGIARLFVFVIFLKRFEEMRVKVESGPLNLVFIISRIRPILGLGFDLISSYFKNNKKNQ